MKRVKLTRGTVVQRRPAMAGEVIDLPDAEAAYLIAIGKALEIEPAAQQRKNGQPDEQKQASGLSTETAGALVKGKRRHRG